jgi:hypothetical protein
MKRLLLSFATLAASMAAAPVVPDTAPAPAEQDDAAASWLKVRFRAAPYAKELRYSTALADLNGDGTDEALLYLVGSSVCGSGGCNLYVLQKQRGRWKLITNFTIAKLPVRLLATRSRGWSDLGLSVSGGGVRAHEARLSFDGRSYPRNPTVPPAGAVASGARGRVLISDSSTLHPLVPKR